MENLKFDRKVAILNLHYFWPKKRFYTTFFFKKHYYFFIYSLVRKSRKWCGGIVSMACATAPITTPTQNLDDDDASNDPLPPVRRLSSNGFRRRPTPEHNRHAAWRPHRQLRATLDIHRRQTLGPASHR